MGGNRFDVEATGRFFPLLEKQSHYIKASRISTFLVMSNVAVSSQLEVPKRLIALVLSMKTHVKIQQFD